MTLSAALEKADRQMDDIFDRILCDAEDFIRGLGGTDSEVAVFVQRKRDELADTRRQIHEMVSVAHWTSFDSVSCRLN